MVSNRELSLGISGIVVGVMLGMSTLLYGQTPSLDASTVNPNVSSREVLQNLRKYGTAGGQRVLQKLQPAAPTLKSATSTDASVHRVDTENCRAVTDALKQVEDTLNTLLPTAVVGNPDNVKNTAVLQAVADTEQALVDQYCPEVIQTASSSSAKTVNNVCFKYTGARYTSCKANELRGATYP